MSAHMYYGPRMYSMRRPGTGYYYQRYPMAGTLHSFRPIGYRAGVSCLSVGIVTILLGIAAIAAGAVELGRRPPFQMLHYRWFDRQNERIGFGFLIALGAIFILCSLICVCCGGHAMAITRTGASHEGGQAEPAPVANPGTPQAQDPRPPGYDEAVQNQQPQAYPAVVHERTPYPIADLSKEPPGYPNSGQPWRSLEPAC